MVPYIPSEAVSEDAKNQEPRVPEPQEGQSREGCQATQLDRQPWSVSPAQPADYASQKLGL